MGLAVGGQDLICVRQTPSSEIPPAELRAHLEDLGDALFSDEKDPLLQRKARDGNQKVQALVEVLISIFMLERFNFAI